MKKEPCFRGSYFAARIVGKSHGRYKVRYETKVEEDEIPLEENLTKKIFYPILRQ